MFSFITGTDEHGQKVQEAAKKRGVDPKAHCDEMAPRFLELWERLNIKYDDFIRTTESRHISVVQDILQTVYDNGDIYEDEYEGLYSVSEERFITEKEADSGQFKDIKKLKEKNYFFKMSKYQKTLINHINKNPNFIQPAHRKNEVLGFLKKPLEDLCISRPKSRLSWGIDLPFDSKYVTYVWFDALINYVTAAGFNSNEEMYKKVLKTSKSWEHSDQLMYVVGATKAKYKAPFKQVLTHGFTVDQNGHKMSKSVGNVVDPLGLIKEYGVDPVRYYLMREMVLGNDASFTMESFIKRYNSDLANDFGNLLSRVTNLLTKFFDSKTPKFEDNSIEGNSIKNKGNELIKNVSTKIEQMKVNEAIELILQFIRSVNKYLEIMAPWKLVKSDKESAGKVLFSAAEALRVSSLLLSPVMPDKTSIILKTFCAEKTSVKWGELTPNKTIKKHEVLFPRIDINKIEKENISHKKKINQII